MEDAVASPDRDTVLEDHVGSDLGLIADRDLGTDDAVGTDDDPPPQLGLGMDQSGRVDLAQEYG